MDSFFDGSVDFIRFLVEMAFWAGILFVFIFLIGATVLLSVGALISFLI